MTPKQQVLKRWPDAYCEKSALGTGWYVWREANDAPLGRGYTAREAWADAARSLRTAERSSKT